jgi:hypothetical protein
MPKRTRSLVPPALGAIAADEEVRIIRGIRASRFILAMFTLALFPASSVDCRVN